MSVKEGELAPRGVLEIDRVFDSYLGVRNIVLYFYPKDDTPGCTREAQGFKDAYRELVSLDTVVLGVSKDDVVSHRNFQQKHQLPFELIPDVDAEVSRKYGVLVEKSMFGRSSLGIERSTFLIDKDGRIRKVWRNVKVDGHVQDVLDAVKEIHVLT